MSEATSGQRKCLYLLDAMALAYRSHFIFEQRPLINKKGENTSAAYGFTTALIKLIRDHGIEHFAVVFDAPGEGGTFRDEMYADYKAHRPKMPEDLAKNIPYIKEIVRALDFPVLEMPGVEADDVIGSLAKKAEAEQAEVVIVSPDKDFQQLLSQHISVYRMAYKGIDFNMTTLESFQERFGLEPEQFVDFLALKGDASDNVPGVPGIGDKTAIQLLQQYGTVENILDHAEEVSGKKAREGLLGNRDKALLSKRLVEIKTDLPLDIEWEKCRRTSPNMERLERIFGELEFRSLLERFRDEDPMLSPAKQEAGAQPAIYGDDPTMSFDFGPYEEVQELDLEQVDYGIIRNRVELEGLVTELSALSRLSVDTETTSRDAMIASLVGISMSWAEGQGRYVPTPLPDGTSTEEILDALRPILEGDIPKLGQNLKYDIMVFARHGVHVKGPLFDTMVAHYLIAPEEVHNLDAIARKYLSYKTVPISDLIGSGRNQISMRDVPLEKAGPYACEDADIALRLAGVLRKELEDTNLLRIAEEIEFPLIYVLVDMELAGVRIDPGILKEISVQITNEIESLEKQIYEAAGESFNIGSTQQLGAILFDKLELRVVSKTATGKPSTRENVLEELSTEHPLPGLILDWRKLTKLKNTYVDSLTDLIHPETGRVHTSYSQTTAATGRLSSSDPNLQNIPVRTEMGREVRKAFVAANGCMLMAADYVQIELRILADMSGDETLRRAFMSGEDIHLATAARMYKVEPADVTRDMRRKAKEVNYAIPYGITAWGLAQRLRSSVKEAQELIDQYQRSYPRVMAYLNDTIETARQKGYVETKLGRRRYVPEIDASNRAARSFAERVAVNMPIQGTQADMIKIAMVHIHDQLRSRGLKTLMLLQVHDELVFEAPPEELEAVRTLVDDLMTGALPLDVPVEVDLNIGDNWLDAH